MLQNVLYSFFFGAINLLIYLKLEKSIRLKRIYWSCGFVLIAVFAHLGFMKSEFLMHTEDFFNILFFSVALVVIHFAANIQVSTFNDYSNPSDTRGQKLQTYLLLAFDFMRQKLIYVIISIYQFLAVWDEILR